MSLCPCVCVRVCVRVCVSVSCMCVTASVSLSLCVCMHLFAAARMYPMRTCKCAVYSEKLDIKSVYATVFIRFAWQLFVLIRNLRWSLPGPEIEKVVLEGVLQCRFGASTFCELKHSA